VDVEEAVGGGGGQGGVQLLGAGPAREGWVGGGGGGE
jgi:hypothetical protein